LTELSIKQLLDNEPWETKVKSLDITVKVRDPSIQDKIDARVEAKKHPLWKEMDAVEQATEITNRLILKMLVDPKISYEEYVKYSSPKIDAIIETVSLAWYKRVEKFTGNIRKEIKDFLDQKMESSRKSSSSS